MYLVQSVYGDLVCVIVSTVMRSLCVEAAWLVLVMVTSSSGPQVQFRESTATCGCAPVPVLVPALVPAPVPVLVPAPVPALVPVLVPVLRPGSEQDLHPEVVLLGFVVAHAHLQHPPGLHLLDERHVAGMRVEATLP